MSSTKAQADKKLVTDLLDVRALADRQATLDKERTHKLPELLARKNERMGASPLAFLRGAAPLFYEMLAVRPELADGPPGEGWLIGDLHLENFGAYRIHRGPGGKGDGKDREVVFNLNDFDDTIVGPWRFDLLRLMTSLILGIRTLGPDGAATVALCDHLLDAWAHAAFDGKMPSELPKPVAELTNQVRSRTRGELLDARTSITHGKRRFVRGPRYQDLPKDILAAVPEAFDAYIATTPEQERPEKACLEILDAAQRIAGTGSLGSLRVALLTEGKGSPHGCYIFDLKEQGSPSGVVLLDEPALDPAERVVTGYRAAVAHPPRMLGTTKIHKTSMFGRRLAPQEDKVAFDKLEAADLPGIAAYFGALVGAAHARGAAHGKGAAHGRWSKSDREDIRARAFALAGLHESVYLALCSHHAPKR